MVLLKLCACMVYAWLYTQGLSLTFPPQSISSSFSFLFFCSPVFSRFITKPTVVTILATVLFFDIIDCDKY